MGESLGGAESLLEAVSFKKSTEWVEEESLLYAACTRSESSS